VFTVVRIENYMVGQESISQFGRKNGAKLWRRSVRWSIWEAFLEAKIPRIETRDDIIIVFGEERELIADQETQNPQVVVIFIEGFEKNDDDRPLELREQLARLIGKAVVGHHDKNWRACVLPKRYSSMREGAVVVDYPDLPEETFHLQGEDPVL